ncbi:MAG: hypothetical protein NTV49_03925, partial [Kiritimatiellaeota bacterium]|nr:hypothetical protein [Kiritimatiellota bacterium]
MMKPLVRGGNLGWVTLAVLLLGCATPDELYFRDVHSRASVYVAPVPAAIHKVAIMPFKSPTELIGLSVSDLFVTEMLRAGRYELVERSQMAKVLSESELSLAGLSATKAAEVGNMIGADGVVIGTVDEYATVAQRGHPYPVVAISVRMIDCASGKVLWSADLARRADTKEITLPEQARRVTHELIAGLYQRWGVQTKITRPPAGRAPPAVPVSPDQPVGRMTPSGLTVSAGPPAPAAGFTASSGVPVAPAPAAVPADFKVSDMGVRAAHLTWAR